MKKTAEEILMRHGTPTDIGNCAITTIYHKEHILEAMEEYAFQYTGSELAYYKKITNPRITDIVSSLSFLIKELDKLKEL